MNFVLRKESIAIMMDKKMSKDMRNNNTIPLPFSSFSSPPSSNHNPILNPTHQNLWLISLSDSRPPPPAPTDPMDLSLCSNPEETSSHNNNNNNSNSNYNNFVQKEHMFDKVVTPSDVGKLNRLVIPKQNAEKYFPLDSSSDEKGLHLNFEDRNGKSWRFRYCYWNSSQSYVMTKGWSRFVKEKKLDAGDIVSFQRGLGELGKGRLFIDSRRRPDPGSSGRFQIQNPYFTFGNPPSLRRGALHSLPETVPFPRTFEPLQSHPLMNYGVNYPYNHQQQEIGTVGYGNVSPLYLGSAAEQAASGQAAKMAIDSLPIVVPENKAAAAKTLRLFGVNMEFASEADSHPPSSSTYPVRAECSEKGKSSMSFDLDL